MLTYRLTGTTEAIGINHDEPDQSPPPPAGPARATTPNLRAPWCARRRRRAAEMDIDVSLNGSSLVLSIRDDGVGGADSSTGSGLIGLIDRVEALGGHMQIASPPGGGTALHVAIPISA